MGKTGSWSAGRVSTIGIGISLVVLAGLFAASCGSDSAVDDNVKHAATPLSRIAAGRHELIPRIGAPSAPGRIQLRRVPWHVVATHGQHEVEISSEEGYCVGAERPPKYEAVRVIERSGRVTITTFVRRRNSSPPGGVCAGVGYGQYGTVQIGKSLKNTRLFDASVSPPRLRWPGSQG